MTYLRYSPTIEQPDADEQATIDGIIKGMTAQTETVEQRKHHAVRASHAKSSACVVGELVVPEYEDSFRHAAAAYFAAHDATYELKAQLWTDEDRQPIEDAPVDWPVEVSPYRTIATIRLPRQAAYGPERVRYFDEVMTFTPAHSLAAHRPLGSVMRARLQVYQALSDFHHRENGIALANAERIADIPT
ncbi:hypothetical protein [Sphingomonas bacterium]|uniref:hypothetical protein n=1 Tax=Sphingomonas bacterium TaxID=1895847 RepID=UPI001575344A|nr:hypothetical protein [Sphingomonas bacterium]